MRQCLPRGASPAFAEADQAVDWFEMHAISFLIAAPGHIAGSATAAAFVAAAHAATA